MARTWVKAPGRDTWHWCRNCNNYPSTIEKKTTTKPTSGEFCNECIGKEKNGNCRE